MTRHLALLFVISALCLFSAGCYVPAAQPWLGGDTLANLPELAGTWNTQADDAGESFVIEQDENAAAGMYRITYREKDKTVLLTARAGKIGDAWYLDTTVREFGDYGGATLFHSVPTHNAMRLRFENDNAVMRYDIVNPEWMEQRVIDGTLELAHQQITINPDDKEHGYLCLVTASTREMTAFLETHAGDAEFFREGGPLYRITENK